MDWISALTVAIGVFWVTSAFVLLLQAVKRHGAHEAASRDRLALLWEMHRVYHNDPHLAREAIDAFDAVSAESHADEIMAGRDPWLIYGEAVRDFINPPTEVPFQ